MVRLVSPPVFHHAVCTNQTVSMTMLKLQQHKGNTHSVDKKRGPFALSVNFTSWAEWTEVLKSSSVCTQDSSHPLSFPSQPSNPPHTHPQTPHRPLPGVYSFPQCGNGHIVLQGPFKWSCPVPSGDP